MHKDVAFRPNCVNELYVESVARYLHAAPRLGHNFSFNIQSMHYFTISVLS